MKEFKSIQRILSHVRKAVEEYDMIENGDRIAVGISGGKDSLTLLCALAHLRIFLKKEFTIINVPPKPAQQVSRIHGLLYRPRLDNTT